MQKLEGDRLLTTSQVAAKWGMSVRTLKRHLKNGTIRVQPCTRIGQRYRWRESDIDTDIRRATLQRSPSLQPVVKLH